MPGGPDPVQFTSHSRSAIHLSSRRQPLPHRQRPTRRLPYQPFPTWPRHCSRQSPWRPAGRQAGTQRTVVAATTCSSLLRLRTCRTCFAFARHETACAVVRCDRHAQPSRTCFDMLAASAWRFAWPRQTTLCPSNEKAGVTPAFSIWHTARITRKRLEPCHPTARANP